MKTATRKLGANLGESRYVESRDPRVIVRHLKSWHKEATKAKSLWIGATYTVGSKYYACMYVGFGHPKGLYLLCEHQVNPILSLYSVGPRGLTGRARMIVFDDCQGNPHVAPVQCLVPHKVGFAAIEYFLTHEGLPLTVEWASPRGISYNKFVKRWSRAAGSPLSATGKIPRAWRGVTARSASAR